MRAPSAKPRVINWGCAGPLLAYLAVAGGLVAGAIYFDRHSPRAPMPGTKLGAVPSNTLIGELARCQALGPKAENDQGCIEAWAENRRRFLDGAAEPATSTTSQRMHQP